jgi:lipopolysaccharide export system permease protein
VPISATIGTIYALAQFAANSEFTAMRAAGLGRRQALATVARIGLFIAILTALVGEGLAPAAERLAQQLRLSAIGASVAGQFRSGLWLKDSVRGADGQVERLRFVNIGELLPDGTLRDVRVFEFDVEMRLSEIVHAESARYAPPDAWRLAGVDATRFVETRIGSDAPVLRAEQLHPAERLWKSDLTPALLGVLLVQPDRMSALSLYRYVRHLQENRQNSSQYEIALAKKLVYPLAVIVMMALALPFAYLQARAGGIGYKVFAGIMLGIAFHFLNGLFSHLGLLNTWPPLLSVSIPSLGAFALALGMLAWVDRTR